MFECNVMSSQAANNRKRA